MRTVEKEKRKEKEVEFRKLQQQTEHFHSI